MDELNSTQLILLALLVSFVTSIATGIVTVTLMDQAPAGVTQTINRVIQKTERVVVPQKDADQSAQSAQALLAAEEEMIARVITTHADIVAPLYVKEASPSSASTTTTQRKTAKRVGHGVLVASKGLLVTSYAPEDTALYVSFDNGSTLASLAERSTDGEDGAFVYAIDATTTPARFPSSSVPAFADVSAVRVGQAVVAISRTGGELHVRRGIISGVDAPEGDSAASPVLHTSFEGDSILDNSALFTLEGDLIGVLQHSTSGMLTVSVETIKEMLSTTGSRKSNTQEKEE